MQYCIKNCSDDANIIINTLSKDKQGCLIFKTRTIEEEEGLLNRYLHNNIGVRIIVYGENASDETIVEKYRQLAGLGFNHVYIYPGGLFEWLLLQDIYGEEPFPTMGHEMDILKYKGKRILASLMIGGSP